MKHLKKLPIVLVVLLLLVANLTLIPKAFAGTLTASSVIELGASNANPMIVSDGQSLAIAFTTAGATGTNPSITLTFTGWTGGSAGSVNATQSISNTGCTALTGASAGLPGTLSASGNASTGVITISSSGGSNSLSATTSYCTELTSTSAVTNPNTPGVYQVTINDGVDSQTDAIDVLSSGANAYSITAVVGQYFTMSLSGTTDSFSSNLSSSAVTTSTGITTTINTNAASGWFVWAEDANAGLKSTSASKTINSVSTGSNHAMNGGTIGTEAYALGVSADNTTNYAYGGGTTGGGLSTSTFNEIATNSSPASNVTFVTHELADISNTTPPATDYTDTITEIGAGSF